MTSIETTAVKMLGGLTSVAGTQQKYTVTFTGTWAAADTFTFIFTIDGTGVQYQVGKGDITGKTPTFVLTFDDKVYLLAGSKAFFSAVGEPTKFNDPNTGTNSYVDMSNTFGDTADLIAVAPYQGKLAFFSEDTIQIWTINADPAQWAKLQTLSEIGTIAKESVKSVGDLDVVFLSNSGFRSLRARDASSNAIPIDLGSPIDELVLASLAAASATEKAAANGVVDPQTKRYWCFIKDVIYVLSYYPTTKVVAWSTYTPTYQVESAFFVGGVTPYAADSTYTITGLTVGSVYKFEPGGSELTATHAGSAIPCTFGSANTYFMARATTITLTGAGPGPGTLVTCGVKLVTATAFTPQVFIKIKDTVLVRDADSMYAYGGDNNALYDNCECLATLPWLGLNNPAKTKVFSSLDIAIYGEWLIKGGVDYLTPSALAQLALVTKETYEMERIPFEGHGTHFKLTASSIHAAADVLGSIVVNFSTEK